ncbi:MAG: hypothetical protein KF824_04425 [Fimbriimonadaceae bacterium]|nr:MAG: hypothetical protein KF824_04425 [Fimbriimonadaceae bacterium]
MSHEFELMHAYADGEVSASEAAEAKRLLETDAQCRAEYEWALSMKAALADGCKPIANEEGWKSCVGRLDELDRVKRAEGFVGKYAWALCGALMLMIVAGGFANRMVSSRVVTSTQIASVLDPIGSGVAVSRNPDISAARQLNLQGFTMTSSIGGRLDNREFVRFGLRDRNGLGGLSVVVVAGADRVEGVDNPTQNPGIRKGQMNGVNCVTWNLGNNTCILFGERTPDELVALAEQMAR